MSDSDGDDAPQLSADTLAALKEFYTEQDERKAKMEKILSNESTAEIPDFQEDWVCLTYFILFSILHRLETDFLKSYFHKIEPYKKYKINGFNVTAFLMDHPDPCYGFRIEDEGKIYAHAVDNEAIRTTKAQLGIDGGLFEDANLLFFDAQYDEEDMAAKKGWGHGTCDRGFEVALHFGVQQILFAHHDPSFSIKDIWIQKKKAELSFEKNFTNLKAKWDFAVEGQIIEL